MRDVTWLLIANGSCARVMEVKGPEEFRTHAEFSHQESRMRGKDLETDGPGSSGVRATGIRHGMEPTSSPQEIEVERFASQLVDYLDKARVQGELKRLCVAASPQFLGLLRKTMKAPLRGIVAQEFDKDLSSVKESEISKHIYVTLH